jgi:hypothetical protein
VLLERHASELKCRPALWEFRGPTGLARSQSAFPTSSGSRATLTAIRRASPFVSTFLKRFGFAVTGVDVGERLPVGVTDDVAARPESFAAS